MKIMVITFQENFREQLIPFLEKQGFEVCVPPHREDVLPMANTKQPLVVVLDMYVSTPNGIEVLQQLRTQGYKGRVVLLGGSSVSSLISQAFHFGVDQVVGGPHLVGDPINLGQVETAIRTSLHSLIATRALELYESKGRTQGHDLDDWLEAEREILNLPSHARTTGKPKTDTATKKNDQKES
jgi:DNA-binding NarL/FixJ family response regulator